MYKYCVNCGSKLIASIEELDRFDTETGEKQYRVKIRCPKAKWYNSCANGHIEYIGADYTSRADVFTLSEAQKKIEKFNYFW